LVDKKGIEIPTSLLQFKKLVGFYFCKNPGSEAYTSELIKFYENVKRDYGETMLEIIQIHCENKEIHTNGTTNSNKGKTQTNEHDVNFGTELDVEEEPDTKQEIASGDNCPSIPWLTLLYDFHKEFYIENDVYIRIRSLLDIKVTKEPLNELPKLVFMNLNFSSKSNVYIVHGPPNSERLVLNEDFFKNCLSKLCPNYITYSQLHWNKEYLDKFELFVTDYNLCQKREPNHELSLEEKKMVNLQSIFPRKLYNSEKQKMSMIHSLEKKRLIGLLWSASWCGECIDFTNQLVEFYEKVKQAYGPDAFEIVLIDSETIESKLYDYIKQKRMPWLTISFYETKGKHQLMSMLQAEGIPKLYVLDPITCRFVEGCNHMNCDRLKHIDLFSYWLNEMDLNPID
jgi:thiol-disulfide isomerase/thioredoxin